MVFPSREAQTSISCPNCTAKLHIKRSCQEAYMSCEKCHSQFTMQKFIPLMDDVMEDFLENLHLNRI